MTQYCLMQYYSGFSTNLLKVNGLHFRRGVVPGGVAPPDFGRSVNPISTRGGGRLCLLNNTGNPGFSDLPTALLRTTQWDQNFGESAFNRYNLMIFCQLFLWIKSKSLGKHFP